MLGIKAIYMIYEYKAYDNKMMIIIFLRFIFFIFSNHFLSRPSLLSTYKGV